MRNNNLNLFIYTEGGLRLGLGNVYRSLSFAHEIKKVKDINITFVTSSEQYVQDIIHLKGFSVIFSLQNGIVNIILKHKPSILLIDYLGINAEFVSTIKRQSPTKIVIVGNTSEANQYAEIVINAIIGTNFENKSFVDQYGTLNLFGPKYLVLRDEFEKLRYSYIYRGVIKNIVLLFGGSDQANYTYKILQKLLISMKSYNIIIIVGAGYTYNDELHSLISVCPQNIKVTILENINNVSEVYSLADFLITSPGTALFEGLCMGIPSISFYQNESQKEVFSDFFTTQSYADDIDIIDCMNKTYLHMNEFNKQLKKLSVGEGREEIINSIVKLLDY